MKTRHLFNFVWTALIAATLVAAPARYIHAQTNIDEPSIVISIANVDEQLKDVKYILRAAEMGMMGMMLDGMIDEFTPGLDRTKSIGLFLYINEENPGEPDVLGFVPVTDYQALLDKVTEGIGRDSVEQDGDLTIITTPVGESVYIKQSNGYAFLSRKDTWLSRLPTRPEEELSKWAGNYNIGAKVYGQRIPESLRDQMIEAIESGFQMQLEQMEDREPALADLQRKNFEMQMEQIKGLVHETQELVFGIAADKDSENLFMDFRIVGVEGSKFARQCNNAAEAGKSRFGGFVMEKSFLNGLLRTKSTKEDVENATLMIGELRSTLMTQLNENSDLDQAQQEKLESIMDDLADCLEATAKTGEADAGFVATVELGNINFAAAMTAAETGKFRSAMDKLVDFTQDAARDESVELESRSNAATVNGVSMEMLTVKVPEEEQEARSMFGESISLYYGVNQNTVYVCVGSSPIELLEKALASEGAAGDVPAMQMNLYLAPMMRMIANMENDETAGQMAELLEDSGKDRITITAKMISNGQEVRISAQDGVLKLIGVVASQFGGMGGNDF
jgi:hypothetical protein